MHRNRLPGCIQVDVLYLLACILMRLTEERLVSSDENYLLVTIRNAFAVKPYFTVLSQ